MFVFTFEKIFSFSSNAEAATRWSSSGLSSKAHTKGLRGRLDWSRLITIKWVSLTFSLQRSFKSVLNNNNNNKAKISFLSFSHAQVVDVLIYGSKKPLNWTSSFPLPYLLNAPLSCLSVCPYPTTQPSTASRVWLANKRKRWRRKKLNWILECQVMTDWVTRMTFFTPHFWGRENIFLRLWKSSPLGTKSAAKLSPKKLTTSEYFSTLLHVVFARGFWPRRSGRRTNFTAAHSDLC